MKSNYASVNGIKMYYEVYGESNDLPLVLIHGGGSTIPSNWGAILPMLTKEYTVIAMEMQAHGRTSDRDAPESFRQDAADVVGLLQHLNVKKANIIGFSDGACTTLEIAINYPDVVNKIVVISGNYKKDGMIPGFFEGLQNVTFNDMPLALRQAYLAVNPDENGLLNMFNKDKARRLAFEDRTEAEMKSIKAAALLMVGDRDVITTEHTVQMSRLIPDARLAVLPGNHGSFIGEVMATEEGSRMPEMAVGVMKEFLNKK